MHSAREVVEGLLGALDDESPGSSYWAGAAHDWLRSTHEPAVERYNCTTGGMELAADGDYVLFSDLRAAPPPGALHSYTQPAVIQQVWMENGTAIVLGIPAHFGELPEDHEWQHNCDAMGCGQCHVLARIPALTKGDSHEA